MLISSIHTVSGAMAVLKEYERANGEAWKALELVDGLKQGLCAIAWV